MGNTRTSDKNRNYEAVIFDMDGLMFNTEELYYSTFNDTLHEFNASLDRPGYISYVGHPIEENSSHAVEHYDLDTSPEDFSKLWMDRFDLAISDPEKIEVMPGLEELLNFVRVKPYRLGVASSTERIRMMKTLENGLLTYLQKGDPLDRIFEVILSGSDVARTKPAPDIYLLAANRLGLPPSSCLAFEDSESGVRSARSAGMDVIAVPNFFTAHQDHSATELQLTSLVEALSCGIL